MDADFQAKLERALTWAGMWREVGRKEFVRPDGSRVELPVDYKDKPCPSLTDELAMRLLRFCCPQGARSRLSAFEFDLIQARVIGGCDLTTAIVLAVSALAEKDASSP